MNKYIDADKLKRHYAWWDDETKKIFDEIIDLQPTADVQEVRHGHWKNDGHTLACSNCHTINIRGVAWDYCPHCGAIMDKEENA